MFPVTNQYDSMIRVFQFVKSDVTAQSYIPHKSEVGVRGGLFESVDDVFHFRMVWSDAVSDQAVGDRQFFVHVDRNVWNFLK